MSISRKPVPSFNYASPNPQQPPPPSRAPPLPPPAEPLNTSEPLSQVEYDSDFDWDACDDEDITATGDHSASKLEEEAINTSNAPETRPLIDEADSGRNIPPAPVSNDLADQGGLSPNHPLAIPPRSPLRHSSSELVQGQNTKNPFLRKDFARPVTTDYVPSPGVWDDPIEPESRDSKPPQEDLIDLEYPVQSTAGLPPESNNSSDQESHAPSTLAPPEDVKAPYGGLPKNLDTALPDPKNQRNEFYQIKHIRWFDASSKENPRHSSILTQNANGPCPLLALVNCLVLSTPALLLTPLVEALRTREQISLGLLLDAVFDELTSERRCSSTGSLPDVAELYSFLITLHTGMNVNPRFVFSADLKRISTTEVIPGAFEETREVSLYGAFSIPLIHGWLPHRNESAFEAFERTAPTYEDAQNVQFREEELEDKLASDTLTADEQLLLDDVKTIKQFLVYWPTQLTAHGLDVIDRFLKPGAFCILFRNDHFSTVHKEAYSNRLMTLVTDAGFATHDEIVWETLVDINGANCEFCSGDFRSVSHHDQAGSSSAAQFDNGIGWTTVETKKGRKSDGVSNKTGGAQLTKSPPQRKSSQQGPSGSRESQSFSSATAFDLPDRSQREISAAEQEDLDLALALQLQEEEEERQRAETASRARERENSLSEQFISRETSHTSNATPTPAQASTAGAGGRAPVQIPVRRSGQTQNNPAPPRPAAATEAENDGAPPPYEFAASAAPFHPPRNHPASEHAPLTPLPPSTQSTPAYGTNSSHAFQNPSGANRLTARQGLYAQDAAFGVGRRGRPPPALNASGADRDGGDRCVMM